MSLIKTHKVALAPTPAQGTLLAQHAGYARVAYNHALADFKACLGCGEWLTDMDLRRRFNAQKREVYPWCAELSQNASKYAVIAVGDAVKAWKNDKQANHFPVFKSRRPAPPRIPRRQRTRHRPLRWQAHPATQDRRGQDAGGVAL